MQSALTAPCQITYDALFQHPVARHLKWIDIRTLLVAIADSVDERGDILKVTRNGMQLLLHHPPRAAMGDIAELMKLRTFLEHSATRAVAGTPR